MHRLLEKNRDVSLAVLFYPEKELLNQNLHKKLLNDASLSDLQPGQGQVKKWLAPIKSSTETAIRQRLDEVAQGISPEEAGQYLSVAEVLVRIRLDRRCYCILHYDYYINLSCLIGDQSDFFRVPSTPLRVDIDEQQVGL